MILSAAAFPDLRDWLMLGIATDVSIILFVIALKIDRTSASRLLVLLDEDRRKIIDFLSEEKTFEEINAAVTLAGKSKSNLSRLLSDLKKLGFIHERHEYVIDESGKRRIKKFIRSF
jgi:DNA-binding transcriptional ArsR family regulator